MIFKIKTDNFLPHQLEWWNLPNFIKLLVGGFGCGKTYAGAMRSIYLSYIHAPLPGQYISPTYDMLQKTIIPTLKDIGLRSGLNIVYNQQRNRFTISNWGGEIWLGSGDRPDSLRGPNLAWAGIDEPFIQKQDVLTFMLSRIRVGDPEKRELFLTGTPESLNWGYDLSVNEDKRYDIGTVVGKTKDNVHLGPEYYETLRQAYSEEQQRAFLDGEFVNMNVGRAYKMFTREDHVVHLDYGNLEVCAGVDFNVDYMSAEIFAHGNGWIHFFDEIRLGHSNSFELSERLADKYPGIKVYPDATGATRKTSSTKSDHQIFRDMGFHVIARKSNPAVMDRVNAVNKMLMNGHLTIEPNKCPMLVKDLERVVFKSGDLDKQSDESLTHASDAAGYAVSYLYPVRKRSVYTIGA